MEDENGEPFAAKIRSSFPPPSSLSGLARQSQTSYIFLLRSSAAAEPALSSCSYLPSEQSMEEDDEFDWEAAVREIDVACQGAASTSNTEIIGNSEAFMDLVCDRAPPKFKKPCHARQSTLDALVRTYRKQQAGSCKLGSNGGSVSYGGDDDGSMGAEDESVSANIDLEAAKTWIYPVNIPMRDYQLSITKTALFSNTLVSLPTGLGKTLIAAVVMYNYFRWFPEGKIVFTAPSRPLVMQQIEACHNIVGIPQEWTIDMTGQMNPSKRSYCWKSKRVFFVTPQVLEKDIQSGTCLVKQVVCLVIDEAHRATGNYSYCVAVRELMAALVQLRILALTATPGSKQVSIQNVINNLRISTLEYRSDTHHDVIPYIHNRRLELVKVTMGEEAVKINDLLLEVIQPFVMRLYAVGVLYKRDIATMSPCDLLNSRDKFRQAPPTSLPQAKYGEIEGCFGVLITLYHIRKLLSSHGIRPAYEMLEEKLQQGSFARFMSKNETMWRVKHLMQQSLSHGAPSPKLSKMKEVLVDHFKTKGPKDSRVIIFSNFRGSVKDIMDTLSNLGDFVKATQFIGQSSGKSLKGQSQKVQQEVLQKFRSGGYNVIVATSIGEEGLDIMEVDLVICFDANISPLRMIQRMGRTGRKHDGRVVVLACEGAELKGYLKKQANSKAIRKHMHNGGITSFAFHPSPRMVPHACKPEVQFVQLSIEKFVPRGRKAKESPMRGSTLGHAVSDSEMERIAKYFHSEEGPWRPSLISFPDFQAFPSSVYKIMHSYRTTAMLVDAVQSLQGLPSFKLNQTDLNEGKHCSSEYAKNTNFPQDYNHEKDFLTIHNAPTTTVSEIDILDVKASQRETSKDEDPEYIAEQAREIPNADLLTIHTAPTTAVSEIEILDIKASQRKTSKDEDPEYISEQAKEIPAVHCYLFETDFVSVNAFGRVLISSVPVLPVKGDGLSCQNVPASFTETLRNIEEVTFAFKTSPTVHKEVVDCDANPVQILEENIKGVLAGQESCTSMGMRSSPDNDFCAHPRDLELSPRLTNFIEKGVVPESPIAAGCCFYSSEVEHMVSNNFSREHCKTTTHMNNYNSNREVEKNVADETWHSPDTPTRDLPSPKRNPCNTPNYPSLSSMKLDSEKYEMCNVPCTNVDPHDNLRSPVIKEIHTPLSNKRANSASEDWCLGSEEPSRSIKKEMKFRRLRKYGDAGHRVSSKSLKEKEASNGIRKDICMSLAQTKFIPVRGPDEQKSKNHARAFIEEEAEVSLDTEVSEDEEDDKNDDKYDDSFIDDRINPTPNTQKEDVGSDMMAVYRRSLLTQSPIVYQSSCSNSLTHESTTPTTVSSRSYSSKKISNSIESQTNFHSARQSDSRKSASCQMEGKEIAPQRGILGPIEGESRIEGRKKKLFHQVGFDSEVKLREDSRFQSEGTSKTSLNCPDENNELNCNAFYDDDFYEGLDLDAVEAQATVSLMCKSELSVGRRPAGMADSSSEVKQDRDRISVKLPSFDLGLL